jgi:hypothetical protein
MPHRPQEQIFPLCYSRPFCLTTNLRAISYAHQTVVKMRNTNEEMYN